MYQLRLTSLSHYCSVKTRNSEPIEHKQIVFHDLTIVISGKMQFVVDGKHFTVTAGDAIYCPSGCFYERFRGVANEYVNYVSFNFYTENNEPLPLDYLIKGCVTPDFKLLLSLYKENHMSDLPNSYNKCEALLRYLIYLLIDYQELTGRNEYVTRAIDYIKSNITHRITLGEVSEQLHLSPEYCSWLFKRETGQTVIGYTTRIKMAAAKELLLKKEMTPKQVAEYLGYTDYSYFSRRFKKTVGFSPKNYV